MNVSYASLCKCGERANNEDNIGIFDDGSSFLFVLADGLGGHSKGEVASQLVTEKAIEAFKNNSDSLEQCFLLGQEALLNMQDSQNALNEMKTTLVCLKISKKKVQWGHIGDSRIYHFRNGKLLERSIDHSVPQMLVSSGEIQEKDIRQHEDRNRLLRVMGIEWNTPKYDISTEKDLTKRDSFLLCSDGFWEWIIEKKMIKLLKKSSNPNDWLQKMELEILKNGKDKNMDNYSAIAVFIS